MASLSFALSNSLMNAVLRSTSYTSPGQVYLACYSTTPTASGGGVEVTGGSYVRAALTFTAPSNGVCLNANEVDILGMPAVTIRGLGVLDASSSGNLLFFGDLLTPKTTNAGDTFTVKVGDLSLGLA